ncbi:MAG: phosphoribosylformylglycinamidine cyclo-ligase [Armatimonadota bacterium]|nr:phosphoribosylformylglycinamidine cyclo-ligase [Armatimonadota bacterium]
MADALTYRAAGVDRAAAARALARAAAAIGSARTEAVVGGGGHFAGLYRLPDRARLLAASVDGVGTKTVLLAQAGRLDIAGRDAVVHGINDVAVLGATPLLALDYVAAGADVGEDAVAAVIAGAASACREESVALVGGETAQMPGVYHPGMLDVAACVIGVVEGGDPCDGSAIRPGDAVLGLASSGLHTNGFSLVRAVLARCGWTLDTVVADVGRPLGEVLLAPHRCYRRVLLALARAGVLRGAAHITGGGLPGNVIRILPPGCRARLIRGRWPVPPIYDVLARAGGVPSREMWATFNMGVGVCAVVPPERAGAALEICRDHQVPAWLVGEVAEGERGVEVV